MEGFYPADGVARELANGFLASRSMADSFASLSWLYDPNPCRIGSVKYADLLPVFRPLISANA